MPHVPTRRIHAYQNRGMDVLIRLDTDLMPNDIGPVTFRYASTSKTGLAAEADGDDVVIRVILSAAEMNLPRGNSRWEAIAEIEGQPRTIAEGPFNVDREPTTAP